MNRHYDQFDKLNLTTRIVEENEGYYLFEDTVFYGEKGGQSADKGTINGYPVTDLKWVGDQLYHQIDAPTLENPILMEVDEDERWANTVIQSAFHLLDGFYREKQLTLIAVSAKLDHQWFEIDTHENIEDLVHETNKFMTWAIRQEIPSTYTYYDGKDYPDEKYQNFNEVRVVSFGDIDQQPCGTCHVKHTGQIHEFVILDTEKTKKGTKFHIAVGPVVGYQLKQLATSQQSMAKSLSTGQAQVAEKVEELLDENKRQKKELKDLKQSLAKMKVTELLKEPSTFIEISTSDVNEVRDLAQLMLGQVDSDKYLYASIDNLLYFAIISPNENARKFLEIIKQVAEVTGGGSPKIVTGKVNMSSSTFVDKLNAVELL